MHDLGHMGAIAASNHSSLQIYYDWNTDELESEMKGGISCIAINGPVALSNNILGQIILWMYIL
jgi:hypothetical protein